MEIRGDAEASFTPCRVQETSVRGWKLYFISRITTSQTTLGQHLLVLFSWVLTVLISQCLLDVAQMQLSSSTKSLPPPHFEFVEGEPEENMSGGFCATCLLRRQDWKPKIVPCLKKETEKAGNVSNLLWVWTSSQNRLGGSAMASSLLLSCCGLGHQLHRMDSPPWLKGLWQGHVLPPLSLWHGVPCDSTAGFEVTKCESQGHLTATPVIFPLKSLEWITKSWPPHTVALPLASSPLPPSTPPAETLGPPWRCSTSFSAALQTIKLSGNGKNKLLPLNVMTCWSALPMVTPREVILTGRTTSIYTCKTVINNGCPVNSQIILGKRKLAQLLEKAVIRTRSLAPRLTVTTCF